MSFCLNAAGVPVLLEEPLPGREACSRSPLTAAEPGPEGLSRALLPFGRCLFRGRAVPWRGGILLLGEPTGAGPILERRGSGIRVRPSPWTEPFRSAMLLGVVLPGEGELLSWLLAGEPSAPAQAMARALAEAVPIWTLPEGGIGQINKIL